MNASSRYKLAVALISSGIILPQSSPARADSASPASSTTSLVGRAAANSTGWKLFGGLGVGYGGVSGPEFESGPRGGQYLLNGNFGYQASRWVAEAGLGWHYTNVSGDDAIGRSVAIRTRAGLGDASWRYRVTDRWQVGPTVGLAFGADTSQAPSINEASANANLGVKFVYQFPWNKLPVRVWQQVSTDLSIPDRRFVVAMIGAQIGIPVSFSRSSLSNIPDVIKIGAAAPVRNPEIRIVLDPQRVFFGTNSSRLRDEVKAVLRNVGEYIQQKPNTASEVVVAGHADQRGAYSYNLKLSKKRALSVREALMGGFAAVPDSSIDDLVRLEAYSFLNPVDPRNAPDAWAKNRRVELVFKDVQDAEGLRKMLEPLMIVGTEK